MKRLLTALVAVAAVLGLLAAYARGGSAAKSLTYPSTTAGCTLADTITSCYDAAGSGGTVTVKPGHYDISAATITLGHPGTLKGTCGTTILDPKNQKNGITVTFDNVNISCVTILNAGTNGVGVFDAGSDNVHVDKITVSSAYDGVEAGDTGTVDGLQVTNSTFNGVGTALNLAHASTSILFSGNKITNSLNNCVSVNSALTNSTFDKNTMTGCKQFGIQVVGGSGNTISNNTITQAISGGIWTTSASSTVSNNKITGSGGAGITVGWFMGHADNAVVTGNTVTSGYSGLVIAGATPDVEKNTVTGVTGGAATSVDCTATCTSLKVLSNTATGGNNFGIYVQLDADGTGGLVSKNTANGNVGGGLYITGGGSYYGGLTISNNTANSNGGALYGYEAGIAIVYSNADTLTSNTASTNGAGGIWIGYANGTSLTGNTAKGNTLDGFELAEGAPATTLIKNTATGNLGDGFNTDQADTVFTNNAASGSGDYDCTYDSSEDMDVPFTTSGSGNKCADKSNFGVESPLTNN